MAKKIITAEARWEEKWKRWKINAQADGQRKSFYSSDPSRKGKKEAEAKAQKWAQRRTNGDPRLLDAMELYLEDQKSRMSRDSYYTKASIVRKWLLPPDLVGRKVSRIGVMDWQHVLDAVKEAGRQKSTIKAYKAIILSFWAFCEKMRWEVDPIRADDLDAESDKEKKEKKILQPDALRRLMEISTTVMRGDRVPEWCIHAFRLAAVLGLRRGEITALRWKDVTETTLTVHASTNARGTTTKGKTGNARRVVVINRHVQPILDAQRAQLKRHGIVSPWVFPADDGQQMHAETFSAHWTRYCDANGIGEGVTFHGLRHTAVSCYKNALPLDQLKRVVGHSASMDTLGVYGHEVDGEAEEAAALMDAAMDRIMG